MSGRIVGEVLDYAPTDLRAGEFLTLLVLAEDARDKDRLARFSDLGSLHRRTRLAPGTVRNALSELARRGLIVPTRSYVGHGQHQEYKLAKLGEQHRGATVHPIRAES